MAREGTKGFSWCSFILSAAVSAILVWLAFRNLTPTCSIEQFDVFALQKPDNNNNNNNNNNTIRYDLKLKNRNTSKGIYYDALNLTFYYVPTTHQSSIIGNVTIEPFYQGFGKTAHRVGDISKAIRFENVDGAVGVFKVELAATMRYKNPTWKTKKHKMMVKADLNVNSRGSLIKAKGNKGIKFSSTAGKCVNSFGFGGTLVILFFIYFF